LRGLFIGGEGSRDDAWARLADGDHAAFECVVEAAAECADAAAPFGGDAFGIAVFVDVSFEDEFVFGVVDGEIVGFTVFAAAEDGAAFVVGEGGGAVGEVDHSGSAAGHDGCVDEFVLGVAAAEWEFAEDEFGFDVFAGAEEGEFDGFSGFVEAEEGDELSFVDEELVAEFPDDVEGLDAGGGGGAVGVDGFDDESDSFREGRELCGGGFVGF
jgi:hypothetical protein